MQSRYTALRRSAEQLRRVRLLRAKTPDELREVLAVVRGRACDLSSVALDDQGSKLHIPVQGDVPRRSGGELIVRRIVEFSMADSTGIRWFDVDGLTYDPHTRQLLIQSSSPIRFLLTVEHLDVAVKISEHR